MLRAALAALGGLTSILCAVALMSTPAQAQDVPDAAVLVADEVYVTPEKTLIAKGNVEAHHQGARIQAKQITYNQATDQLVIEGPIRLDDADGTTVLASSAELDSGFQNGLLRGARVVMGEQLQLASVEMVRVGGRYSQLYKTAVTSCHVCENGRAPLWHIRARKVTHDKLEKQIYFENATLRVLNVPVLYLPRLRIPDPSLKRSAGFLAPSIQASTRLETGVKVPYFIPLGDHADLTLTPHLSPRTRSLGFRYRHLFKKGQIEFEGAYSDDDLQTDTRGYIFGRGSFDLPRDFKLSFDIKAVSDNAYLSDYSLPDQDRLQSKIELSRTKRDNYFRTSLIHYDSLRDSEDETLLPTIVADALYEHRLFPRGIGGELRLAAEAHAHRRSSNLDVLGRDVTRISLDSNWLRNWTLNNGMRVEGKLGFSADLFDVRQDSNYPDDISRVTPVGSLALRYPMKRTEANGFVHALEPVVQLAWSSVSDTDVPTDESGLVEFDRGNLVALSRFPSKDAREDGVVLAYGVNWAGYAPGGWQAAASVGQIMRDPEEMLFSASSGLQGHTSDFLLAGQFKHDIGLSLTGRALFDDALSFSKAEFRGQYTRDMFSVSGSYLWLEEDVQENRTDRISELWLAGRYTINENWTTRAAVRYDTEEDRPTRAGLGVVYRNECVEVDFSVNRDYTSSASVEPTTNFGFTIDLLGYAVNNGGRQYKKRCR